ncbi:PREDICTED: F-box/LRR-repeat protein At3g59200-like [Camelina sativa]|uniref:F-box/LRR-repeat protein At3g59200-like n=1 Tax=Camelina sativa TaxID=90675 RepID=A0ABM0WD09_CAMSA|nr:PREDICTED: F-box/LRR-repeat protein At3g59200-like [Camelina sativa]
MDLISNLPNPLISHILSYLPTKEAASTSVLSKKWRYLFAFVTNLDFDDSDYENDVGRSDAEISTSFMGFVDRVLALQGNLTVNRFSLDCSNFDIDLDRVTGWILNVLGRGVSDLDLSLLEYTLPCEIFVSKTLVKLKLGPGEDLCLTIDRKDVFLPKLKTLYLDSVVVEERGFGFVKLLSGCPVLEELVLMNIGWEYWKFCTVSLKSLKTLTFFREEEYTDENPKSVSFVTPNLVYLEYSDAVAGQYPKVNFSSLVEAHIGLRLTDDQSADANVSEDDYFPEDDEGRQMTVNATDFFKGISSVQILYLSAKAIEVLTFCCEPIPVFNNLIQLTIESHSEVGWDSLPGLLKNCPNLETLVLKRLIHKYNKACGNVCCCKRPKHPSCLSSSPVKVLKIFLFDDNDEEDGSEILQIRYFLEKMPRLEQLIVYYNTSYDPAVLNLSKKLQKVPKVASPKCKIQVVSENLSLTCTVPSFLTTKWSALPPEEEHRWPESPPPTEIKDPMLMYCSSPEDEDYWFN